MATQDNYVNPFSEFLEEDELGRRLLFFSNLPQGLSRGKHKFAEGLFSPTFNRFLGVHGRDPTTSFADFLQSPNFNFNKELAFGDPIATGRARFQAPARFLLRR